MTVIPAWTSGHPLGQISRGSRMRLSETFTDLLPVKKKRALGVQTPLRSCLYGQRLCSRGCSQQPPRSSAGKTVCWERQLGGTELGGPQLSVTEPLEPEFHDLHVPQYCKNQHQWKRDEDGVVIAALRCSRFPARAAQQPELRYVCSGASTRAARRLTPSGLSVSWLNKAHLFSCSWLPPKTTLTRPWKSSRCFARWLKAMQGINETAAARRSRSRPRRPSAWKMCLT